MSSHISATAQTQNPASLVGHAAGLSIHLFLPSHSSHRTGSSTPASLRELSLSNSINRSALSKRNKDEVSAEDNTDSWATVAGKNKKKKPAIKLKK